MKFTQSIYLLSCFVILKPEKQVYHHSTNCQPYKVNHYLTSNLENGNQTKSRNKKRKEKRVWVIIPWNKKEKLQEYCFTYSIKNASNRKEVIAPQAISVEGVIMERLVWFFSKVRWAIPNSGSDLGVRCDIEKGDINFLVLYIYGMLAGARCSIGLHVFSEINCN